MKTLKIEIRILDNKVAKVVEKDGFENSLSGILEYIGLLENLKHNELEKLKTFGKVENYKKK